MGAMLVIVTTSIINISITEIELEENEQRKTLTPGELSKEMVRRVEHTAPIISTVMKEKDSRGRKAVHAVPKVEIARALGVSESSIIRAEQHVEAAAKYPELAAPGSTASVNHGAVT
jgi:hypothetical protein